MSDDQRKILDMVEQGIITAEDAARLLKALGDSPDSDTAGYQTKPETAEEENDGISLEVKLENLGREIESAATGTVKNILTGAMGLLKKLGNSRADISVNVEADSTDELSCEKIDEDFQTAQAHPMTYPAMEGELEALRIHWVRGNIEVRLTEGEYIKVTEYSNPSAAKTTDRRLNWDDSELSITWDDHGQGQKTAIVHLLVELPRRAVQDLEEVEIESIAGTTRVQDLKAEEMSLSTTIGKLGLSELEAETMNLSVVSGMIAAHGVKAEELNADGVTGMITLDGLCAEEAKLETVSGLLEAKGRCGELALHSVSGLAKAELSEMPEEADINTVFGTVELGLPDKESGFTVDFNVQYGTFHSEFPLQGELGAKSGEGIYGDGDAEIDAGTVSGLVKLYRI